MALLYTADTHFGDHRTLNIWRRPFASVAEMDALLVDRWNMAVGVNDEVWHLGDFARRADDVPAFLDHLHGRKHLVRGNNDPDQAIACEGWASVADYAEIDLDDVKLVMCHYPFRSWNGQNRGAINLHGHSPGRLKPMPRQHDVGVDVHAFAPVSIKKLSATPGRNATDVG